MSWIAIAYYTFMFIWIFGGLALFLYVKWETFLRKLKRAKEAVKTMVELAITVMLMLAPFLIPIIVTALTFLFGSK